MSKLIRVYFSPCRAFFNIKIFVYIFLLLFAIGFTTTTGGLRVPDDVHQLLALLRANVQHV